jgi:hypothetical protein
LHGLVSAIKFFLSNNATALILRPPKHCCGKYKHDNNRRHYFKFFTINTSLVFDSFRNQKKLLRGNALDALTIIGFGLLFGIMVILFCLAIGHKTDKDEKHPY